MGRALLILGWLATVGLLSAGLLGFQVTPESGVGLHLLVALFSSLMILFSHSWIMFYLIGTGKAVKSSRPCTTSIAKPSGSVKRTQRPPPGPSICLALLSSNHSGYLGTHDGGPERPIHVSRIA